MINLYPISGHVRGVGKAIMKSILRAGCLSLLAVLAFSAGASTQAAPSPKKSLCKAHFIGPLEGVFEDDGYIFRLSKKYTFIDQNCVEWSVPPKAPVDGASIPRPLWSLIGGPFEGKYRNASVIHDWFCDRRSRPWLAVHRMFFTAMLANGVDPILAKIMYFGVYARGPRWSTATVRSSRIDIRDCPECASVGVKSDMDSGALKSEADARQLRQMDFNHSVEKIPEAALQQFEAKIYAGEVTTPEQIEAFVDGLRPKAQTCPTGYRPTGSGNICEPKP